MVPKATFVLLVALFISATVAQDVEPQYPEDFSTTMTPTTKPPLAITTTTKADKSTTTADPTTIASSTKTPEPSTTTSAPPTSSTAPTTSLPSSTTATSTYKPSIVTTPALPSTTFGGYPYYTPRPTQRPHPPQQPQQPTYPYYHNNVDCFKPQCYYKEDRQIAPYIYWKYGQLQLYYAVDCYHCCRYGESAFAGCNKVDRFYCKKYF